MDDLFCKLLGYLLTCLTRLTSWLSLFVALERVYTTVFLNRQWFKQPHVARYLMFLALVVIILPSLDELLFVKWFTSVEDYDGAMCMIEYSATHQSM